MAMALTVLSPRKRSCVALFPSVPQTPTALLLDSPNYSGRILAGLNELRQTSMLCDYTLSADDVEMKVGTKHTRIYIYDKCSGSAGYSGFDLWQKCTHNIAIYYFKLLYFCKYFKCPHCFCFSQSIYIQYLNWNKCSMLKHI